MSLHLLELCLNKYICSIPFLNSFIPGMYGLNSKCVLFKSTVVIEFLTKSTHILLLKNPIDDKLTLVQVMAWCPKAPSHNLNQCCSISTALYIIMRDHRVNAQPHNSITIPEPSIAKHWEYRSNYTWWEAIISVAFWWFTLFRCFKGKNPIFKLRHNVWFIVLFAIEIVYALCTYSLYLFGRWCHKNIRCYLWVNVFSYLI